MPNSEPYFTIDELIIAYRKAKAEAFYDTNCAHGLKFAAFEEDLIENLQALLRQLNSPEFSWFNDSSFIGIATCIPKSIKPPTTKKDDIHFESSNELGRWEAITSQKKAEAEYRIIINASVEYLIISTLWVIKVGHLFDGELDTRHSRGSRLRRWRAKEEAPAGTPGDINLDSTNLFGPYYIAYGKWRNDGIEAMRSALKHDDQIVAITMDLKQFYHRINADFLLHEDYLSGVSIPLNEHDKQFTRQLVQSFNTWHTQTTKTMGCDSFGLPVGLTASAVIANCLLRDLDQRFVDKIAPLYYGRYVDDIMLVIKTDAPYDSGADFIQWLTSQIGDMLSADDEGITVNLPYHTPQKNHAILFSRDKQKIFQLKGAEGLDLINPIIEQIKIMSSEFRDLPDLPTTEEEMASRALLVSPDAQLRADALRKADVVTLRRSGFALLLSDVESHARDVEANSWQDIRIAFYDLVERHLLVPESFFALSRYLPRVLAVTLTCKEYERALEFIQKISDLLKVIENTCIFINGTKQAQCLKLNLGERLIEIIFKQADNSVSDCKPLIKLIRKEFGVPSSSPYSLSLIKKNQKLLLLTDWSKISFANHWIEADPRTQSDEPSPSEQESIAERLKAIDIFQNAAGLKRPIWKPLVFPTRPIPTNIITLHAPSLLRNTDDLIQVLRGLRGNWTEDRLHLLVTQAQTNEDILSVSLRDELPDKKNYLALTNYEVTDLQWEKSCKNTPDHSLDRYRKLHDLLNRASKADPMPNYILLPELAVPRKWMLSLARKLAQRNISLIAGVEYAHLPNQSGKVKNEALISLCSNYLGYKSPLMLLQPKQSPAWGEIDFLRSHGLELVAPDTHVINHPVYRHGDFTFGVLICSELTDIKNRLRFQGQIDLLMVPEWNKDLQTFSTLVESAALDIHAYIGQSNNRRYGDTRLRGPMKKRHERDIVRVKGGENDYFVIVAIDYMALRHFQAHKSPPKNRKTSKGEDLEEVFKPFPQGFPSRFSNLRDPRPLIERLIHPLH